MIKIVYISCDKVDCTLNSNGHCVGVDTASGYQVIEMRNGKCVTYELKACIEDEGSEWAKYYCTNDCQTCGYTKESEVEHDA